MRKLLNYIFGVLRFAAFFMAAILLLAAAVFVPRGAAGPKFLRGFTLVASRILGMNIRVRGKVSEKRPLLIVGNHISMAEIVLFPVAFGNSFFAKKELSELPVKWFPAIGWLMKKCGIIFVDRRPPKAREALTAVKEEMARATWPMVLFPEGTTTNGAYVKPFKSTLFNFMETEDGIGGATIQPVVIVYRYPDGSKILDEELAEHYAYFDNARQSQGPYCSVERSLFGQLFHILTRGGMLAQLHVLPPLPLEGIKDRKELAAVLQKVVSEEYEKLAYP